MSLRRESLHIVVCSILVISCLSFVPLPQKPIPKGPQPTNKKHVSIQGHKPHVDLWTKTNTERVLRSALPDTVNPRGMNRAVELKAAKNEWEFFQILMRSNTEVKGIDLEPSDLIGPGGAVIPASEAYLYRQHQFEITDPSWGVTQFTPGWYPEPLIPFKNPVTQEPLTDPSKLLAVPFDLPAKQTHGFLVDIKAPADAVPGEYTGVYKLKSDDKTVARIPVSLTVWNFSLPDVLTLKTNFWAPEHQMRHLAWLKGEQHPESYWQAVADQCNELVTRHHIKPVLKAYTLYFTTGDLNPDGSFILGALGESIIQNFIDEEKPSGVKVPFKGCPTIKDVVFGTAWYDENTFDPATFTPQQRDRLINYVSSWDDAVTNLSGTEDIVFYVYLCDEPNSQGAYDYVRELGSAIRNAELNHLKVLVVEQTTPDYPSWGDLYGAVDIWVPYFTSFDPVNAAARQALGESIWTYTALTTWGGWLSWQTDLPLLNYRIPTWLAWRFDMKGLLYWSMAYWWEDGLPDPWETARTYTNYWGGNEYYYNGDGVLVYPADKVGYDGIAPGLRLKAVRDAIEDYEYLVILDNMGLHSQAMAIVDTLATSFTSFVSDPDAYEQARVALAELID